MTIPLLSTHFTAVQTLLAALPVGIVIYDADVPSTPGQTYVVLYPDPGSVTRSSLVTASDHIAFTVQATCVGITALQARDVLDAVRAALVDHVPVVVGRNCFPISEEPGTPPIAKDDKTRDPLIDRPRFYFTPRFRVSSTA